MTRTLTQSEKEILEGTSQFLDDVYDRFGPNQESPQDERDREMLNRLSDDQLVEMVRQRDATIDIAIPSMADEAAEKAERDQHLNRIDEMISSLPANSENRRDWEKLREMSPADLKSEERARGKADRSSDEYLRAVTISEARGVTDRWNEHVRSSVVEFRKGEADRAHDEIEKRGLGLEMNRHPEAGRSKADADRQEQQREEDARRMEQDRATLHDLPNQTERGNNQSFTEDRARKSGLERDREMYPAGPKAAPQTSEKEENKRAAEFLRQAAPHVLPAREIQRQQATEKLKTDRREPKSEFGKRIATLKSSDNNRKERAAPKSDFGRHVAAVKESSEKSETQKTQQEQEQSRGRRM